MILPLKSIVPLIVENCLKSHDHLSNEEYFLFQLLFFFIGCVVLRKLLCFNKTKGLKFGYQNDDIIILEKTKSADTSLHLFVRPEP